jgi:hypothetical protein
MASKRMMRRMRDGRRSPPSQDRVVLCRFSSAWRPSERLLMDVMEGPLVGGHVVVVELLLGEP